MQHLPSIALDGRDGRPQAQDDTQARRAVARWRARRIAAQLLRRRLDGGLARPTDREAFALGDHRHEAAGLFGGGGINTGAARRELGAAARARDAIWPADDDSAGRRDEPWPHDARACLVDDDGGTGWLVTGFRGAGRFGDAARGVRAPPSEFELLPEEVLKRSEALCMVYSGRCGLTGVSLAGVVDGRVADGD